MRWLWFVIPVALPVALTAASPDFRVERQPVAGSAELVTIFGPLSGQPANSSLQATFPLVSILRDTLGDQDPSNDRLRQIWVHTSARPNLLRRAAAALPFFYYRPNLGTGSGRRPAPVLDMAATRRNVWSTIAGQIAQVAALDPNGMWVRSSTRSYRSHSSDLRRTSLLEGLSVLSQAGNAPGATEALPERDLRAIEARLTLGVQTLGGLVDDQHLPEAYYKQRARTEETRGHNWELLRQRAETNGLYFEPLGLGSSRTHALLLIAKEDLSDTMHVFQRKFLDIENPYVDARLKAWQGLTIPAHFDAQGRRTPGPVEGGTARELIPLALYSLEYPKVPLLLADFRAPRATKRREIFRRTANDALIGVFGISRFGNWPYLAGSWTYSFVRSRHGDPNNRGERLKAFTQTRRWLALDPGLDPGLKQELLRRVEMMGTNPLEESVFSEGRLAERQYAALERYAADPEGLAARLDRDRNAERTAVARSWKARFGFGTVSILSFGRYHHKERGGAGLLEALDATRRGERRDREQVAVYVPDTQDAPLE